MQCIGISEEKQDLCVIRFKKKFKLRNINFLFINLIVESIMRFATLKLSISELW